MKVERMESGNTIGHGMCLLMMFCGWVITNITMSAVIGFITIAGGCLYVFNQAYIAWKNIRNK